MKRKLSSYPDAVPSANDKIPGLQKQVSGKYKNVNFPAPIESGAIFILGKKIGFDMNSIADQEIVLAGGSKFSITDILITNASEDLLQGNISNLKFYDAPAGGGNLQVAVSTNFKLSQFGFTTDALNALQTPEDCINKDAISPFGPQYEMAVVVNQSWKRLDGTSLYAVLSAGHGSAATADIYVYGYVLE